MATASFGERDFTQSDEVFEYYDLVRKVCSQFGLESALNAETLHAVLCETYPPGGGRFEAKLRARRVTRQARHIGDILRSAAQAAARTQAAFKREYAQELGLAGKTPAPKKRMAF